MFVNKYKLMWEGLKEKISNYKNNYTDPLMFVCSEMDTLENKYQCYADNEIKNRFEKQQKEIDEISNLLSAIKRLLDEAEY